MTRGGEEVGIKPRFLYKLVKEISKPSHKIYLNKNMPNEPPFA